MLDVSTLEKGSKFACSSCGAILLVGEAQAVKRSLKDSGRAFQRKAASDAATPAPTRTRRAHADDHEGYTPGEGAKSKLPLYLGLGGLVVVAVVVAILLGGGKRRGQKAGPHEETAAEWWQEKDLHVQVTKPAVLKQWLAEARAKGYDQDPAFWRPAEIEIMRSLHRQDPQDAEANRFLGRKSLRSYPDFAKVWEAMNAEYEEMPDTQRAFLDKYSADLDRGKDVWMDPSRFEEAKTLLDAFAAWHKKRIENPAADSIRRGIRNAKAILKGRKFESAVAGPFIVLLPYKADDPAAEARAKELKTLGAHLTAPLKLLEAEFDKQIREPLKLAPIQKGRYFYLVLLDAREDFNTFLQGETGFDTAGDVLGFFSPRTRWAGVALGSDEKSKDLLAGDLCHEAVHQLQWYFSKDWSKKWGENYFDAWTGVWLTEGLAEYLGGGIEEAAGSSKATFTGFASRRVAFLQGMRDNGVPLIPLRDLVQLMSFDDWPRYVDGTWIAAMQEDEDMPGSAVPWLQGQSPGMAAKVLYAHSWYLTRFLVEKHPAKFLDLVMTALRGKRKPPAYRKHKGVEERFQDAYEAFKAIFGLTEEEASWKTFQREYTRYLPKLLRKAKGG